MAWNVALPDARVAGTRHRVAGRVPRADAAAVLRADAHRALRVARLRRRARVVARVAAGVGARVVPEPVADGDLVPGRIGDAVAEEHHAPRRGVEVEPVASIARHVGGVARALRRARLHGDLDRRRDGRLLQLVAGAGDRRVQDRIDVLAELRRVVLRHVDVGDDAAGRANRLVNLARILDRFLISTVLALGTDD